MQSSIDQRLLQGYQTRMVRLTAFCQLLELKGQRLVFHFNGLRGVGFYC